MTLIILNMAAFGLAVWSGWLAGKYIKEGRYDRAGACITLVYIIAPYINY